MKKTGIGSGKRVCLAVLLLAFLTAASGCRRQSVVPQTAPHPAETGGTESPTAVPPSSGTIRSYMELDMPDVQVVAELTAVPAGLTEDAQTAAARLAGVPAEEVGITQAGGPDIFQATVTGMDRGMLIALGADAVPMQRLLYERSATGQVSTTLLTDYAQKTTPLGPVSALLSPLTGKALPAAVDEEIVDIVRSALSGLDLPVEIQPALMVRLDDDVLAAMYEHQYGAILAEETTADMPEEARLQPYREGQGCWLISWSMTADGIPLLGGASDAVTFPQSVSMSGGSLSVFADEKGVVALTGSGMFLKVTGRGEEQAILPATEAADMISRRMQEEGKGSYKLQALRLRYVPFETEEKGVLKLVPCWVGEAQLGSFWNVYMIHAATGEWIE